MHILTLQLTTPIARISLVTFKSLITTWLGEVSTILGSLESMICYIDIILEEILGTHNTYWLTIV